MAGSPLIGQPVQPAAPAPVQDGPQWQDYARWLMANPDKKGTPEFDTIAAAFHKTRPGDTSIGSIGTAAHQSVVQAGADVAQFGADVTGPTTASTVMGGKRPYTPTPGFAATPGIPAVSSFFQGGADKMQKAADAIDYKPMTKDQITGPLSALNYGLHKTAEATPYLVAGAMAPEVALPAMGIMGASSMNNKLRKETPGLATSSRIGASVGAGVIQAALGTLGIGTIFKGIPAEKLEAMGATGVADYLRQKGFGPAITQKFLDTVAAAGTNAATMPAIEGSNMAIEAGAGKKFAPGEVANRFNEAVVSGGLMGATDAGVKGAAEFAGKAPGMAIEARKDTLAKRTVDADPSRAASSQRVMEAMNTRRDSEQARTPSFQSSDDVLAKRVRDDYIGGARRFLNDLLLSNKITKDQRDRWTNGTDGFLKEAGQGNRPLLQSDIDAVHHLGLSPEDTQNFQNVLYDIDTANTNGFKKNLEPGKYEKAGRVAGHVGGALAGIVGGHFVPGFGILPEIAGAAIGGGAGAKFGLADITGGAGRAVDKMMGNQLPAVTRVAAAADRVGMQSDSSDNALTGMQQRARDERVAQQAQRQADAEAEAKLTDQQRFEKIAQRQQERDARQAQKEQDRAAKEQAQQEKLNTQQAARVQAAQAKADAQAQRAQAQAEAQQAKAEAAQKRADELAQKKATRELQAQAKAEATSQKQAATQAKVQAKLDADAAKLATKQEQERIFREQNIKDRENNVVAGGGFHARVYDQTGLLPREQDRGLSMLLHSGDITADEAHNFVHNPHALKANARGLKIEDALNRLADDGHLTRTEEKAAAAQEAPKANNAPEVTPIINPHSYKRAMANINDATNNALKNAPTPEVRAAVADLAENKGTPELKKVALAEMRARFPEHQKFVDEVVAPLAEFGPKRSNILTDEGGGGHPRDLLDLLKKAGGGFRRFLKDERGSLGPDGEDQSHLEDAGFEDKQRARPESTALYDVEMKNGKYRGAPPSIKTEADLNDLRTKLETAVKEGAPGRFWYERSGRAILQAVGGNKVEAEKIAQLIAIFSATTGVKPNFTHALKAYQQFYQTGRINSGKFPEAMSARAQNVMEGNAWGGRKTNNFYINLMRVIDPTVVQGVTNDIHNMRMFGFKNTDGSAYTGSPTDAQYDFVERETRRLMDKLNSNLKEGEAPWEPQQIQAALWVAQKARHQNKPVSEMAYDYADAFNDNTAQVSWESIPGKTSGLFPEMHSAPYSQRAEYHVAISQAFLDAKGGDILAKALHLPTPGEFEAPGYFEGKTNPGSQTKVGAPKAKAEGKDAKIEPSAVEQIDAYAIAKGILLKQDAMAWHRPFFESIKRDANGAEVRIGRPLSPEENARFGESLAKHFGSSDIGPIGSERGARVLNLSGLSNKEFQAKVTQAAKEAIGQHGVDAHVGFFAYQGNYITNDWKAQPNGEGYIGALAKDRPNLQREVRDIVTKVQPRIDAINKNFAAKYGWSGHSDKSGALTQD